MILSNYWGHSGRPIPKTLTIAGSDSGGGAGIQADLKTFGALKTYGQSVITAVTAQNTLVVTKILEIPAGMVRDQIAAIAEDIGFDAFKTGMLATKEIIEVVADCISEFSMKNYILDPVMVAKSGDKLLRDEAVSALKQSLIPMAMVITPNIPEAEVIVGSRLTNESELRDAAKAICGMGPEYTVLKGGHLDGDPIDWVCHGDELFAIPEKRVDTKNTHGSGCTYSAAIAAFVARGFAVERAIHEAKKYVHRGIQSALSIGHGNGPLHHFHPWYKA